MLLAIVISIVSLIVLLVASDWFIDSSEKIGLSLGISPFIIGVTIVAFGTSLPELATSIASVYRGASEFVVGNVIGSNITNILLVLGLTVFVGKEIKLEFNIWNIDMPLLLGSAFLMFFALQDQHISPVECGIFLVALVAFLINSVSGSEGHDEESPKIRLMDIIRLIIGGVFVFLGAKWTIYGIVEVSKLAGIGAEIISLSFVALGTSLPEVAVSMAAAKKGKHAIAVGNVLGSNIFNTYAVMAIPSFFGNLIIPDNILSLSLPFMLAVTVLFGAITMSRKITFWEGIMLLLLYVFYMTELFKNI
ncbi:MAG: calcium/sodium antiporter [Bacteroidia bacterium]|nr:calcium/sodium antiporter [Bacteroidia bacterium]